MGLIRTIVVLSGIAVFMPSPPELNSNTELLAYGEAKSTLAIISAATSTISDVSSFCGRQARVCETAQYVASRLEAKAKYSAKLIYEWANEPSDAPLTPLSKNAAMNADPLQTSAFIVADATDVEESQSTLRLEDIIPEWRGPVLPKNS